jgi:uncharacterized protein (AIM24 family)
MEFTKTLTAGFFGGQGFVLQRLTGEGDVLVKGGGTIVQRDLSDGEVLRVTSGSLVAFSPTVQYDVSMLPGIKNVMFGGEGLFITTLQGPGSVWLQGYELSIRDALAAVVVFCSVLLTFSPFWKWQYAF